MPSVKLKLRPFMIPNYVLADAPPRPRQEGLQETPKFHLSELDDETLEELCAEFRRGVLARAKQPEKR